MRKISDIELKKVKKCFDYMCENILSIPKDAVSFKMNEDGTSYGIYFKHEYYDQIEEFMLSLDGWKPIETEED